MMTIDNVISFFLGGTLTYFIHRLAISRDRRKEYNVIAEEIALALIKERRDTANSNAICSGPKDSDFNKLSFKLSGRKSRTFNVLLEEYNDSKKNSKFTEPDPHGHRRLHDNTLILKSIDKLIKFTKPR